MGRRACRSSSSGSWRCRSRGHRRPSPRRATASPVATATSTPCWIETSRSSPNVSTTSRLLAAPLSLDRRRLIGAYFTHEYSIEAAALGNPSIVAAPDQSGVDAGDVRFVMSLRAIGEGHISSIEFRSGVITADAVGRLDHGQRLRDDRGSDAARVRQALLHDEARRPGDVERRRGTSPRPTRGAVHDGRARSRDRRPRRRRHRTIDLG